MCETKILTVVLILYVFVSKSFQLTVHCEYKNSSTVANGRIEWEIVNNPYACVIETLDIKSKLNVTNVTGTHADGYANGDVKALKIIGGGSIPSDGNTNRDDVSSSCEVIPSGFGSIFPNIEALTVTQAALKSVSSADLKQFVNLREIWFFVNGLVYLESTLFKYNPNVELISFNSNPIKYIGGHFFDYLPKLVTVYFNYDECIDGEAANITELNDLKEKIKENCAITEYSGSLQTTIACQFRVSSDWKIVKNLYGCDLTKLKLMNKLSVINATGNHLPGNKNNDVKAIKIYDGICHIIPSEVGSIFPNIEALSIRNASLKLISSSDLQQFSNLRDICLSGNDIDYLESNLFEYNSKLEIVVVRDNKIQYVGGQFFDFLPHLRRIDLSDNECIDEIAANAVQLSSIKDKIKEKCMVEGMEPRGSTTIRPDDGITYWINNTFVGEGDGEGFGGPNVDAEADFKVLASLVG